MFLPPPPLADGSGPLRTAPEAWGASGPVCTGGSGAAVPRPRRMPGAAPCGAKRCDRLHGRTLCSGSSQLEANADAAWLAKTKLRRVRCRIMASGLSSKPFL